MTSPAMSVTREGMLNAAERMRQALSIVQKERNDVSVSVTGLRNTFGGDAADRYQVAMGNWSANAQEIENALNEMINIMTTGAEQVGTTSAGALDDVEEGASKMTSISSTGLAGL